MSDEHPSATNPERPPTDTARTVRPTHVVVRLDRAIQADAFDDLRMLAAELGLGDLAENLDRFDVPAQRLIRSVPAGRLRGIEIENSDGAEESASLTQYWRIDLRDGRSDPDEVAAAFRELPVVEHAYVEAPVVDAGVRPVPQPPATQKLRTRAATPLPAAPALLAGTETHLDAAPMGIDARWIWDRYGLRGEGVQVLDVEQGWIFDHEALLHLQVPPLLAGVNAYNLGGSGDHGTAVLGVLGGELVPANGVQGICPGASVLAASHLHGADDSVHVASALTTSLDHLDRGDVVLLEVAAIEGAGDTVADQRPIERDEAVQKAIGLLTRCGIVVIEAAGNGDHDLDGLDTTGGRTVLQVDADGYVDSGALMVGGAVVPPGGTPGGAHRRWTDGYNPGIGSNFGSRVDCYSWARRVRSSGCQPYGTCNPRTKAYQTFNATSAASAIIAGAAVLIQSVYRRHNDGDSLAPEHLRALFADPGNGTPALPAPNGANAGIGVMPDLRRVAAALRLPA